MSLLTFISDFSSLCASVDRQTAVLERIAQCLERAIPPIPSHRQDEGDLASGTSRPGDGKDDGFYLAESPEEYTVRMSREATLADSLGVAPWSPAFQKAIQEAKQDIMRKQNEEGREYTEEEAEQLVRDAFKLAKAEANTFKVGGA